MRILVTGGAGFLGAAFAKRARAAGHSIVTMDIRGGVDFRCDLSDPAAVASAIEALTPDAIVHLAALLTDRCAADPVEAARVNALGTAAVFTAAQKVRANRVVYASSIAAVGSTPDSTEDGVSLAPESIYGATKAFGEHLARAMSLVDDQPSYVVLRFGWIYGPGRERGWRVAQEVVEGFVCGERLVRYPDFADPIDWTYVDDAVEVLLRALERPLPRLSVLNVAGDKRTIREAVAHLQRRFPSVIAEALSARTPPSAWTLSNDGLEAALDYVPATHLEDGIDRMLAALVPGATRP